MTPDPVKRNLIPYILLAVTLLSACHNHNSQANTSQQNTYKRTETTIGATPRTSQYLQSTVPTDSQAFASDQLQHTKTPLQYVPYRDSGEPRNTCGEIDYPYYCNHTAQLATNHTKRQASTNKPKP